MGARLFASLLRPVRAGRRRRAGAMVAIGALLCATTASPDSFPSARRWRRDGRAVAEKCCRQRHAGSVPALPCSGIMAARRHARGEPRRRKIRLGQRRHRSHAGHAADLCRVARQIRLRSRSFRSARQYSGGRSLSRRDVRPLRLARLSGRIQRWPPALRGASPWRPTSARRDDGLCRPPRARTWLRQRSGCRNYGAARCAPRADVRHDGGAEIGASGNGGWRREPRWQESKSSASSPLSGAARRQTLCRRTAFGQRLARSIACGFSADRRPICCARQLESPQ